MHYFPYHRDSLNPKLSGKDAPFSSKDKLALFCALSSIRRMIQGVVCGDYGFTFWFKVLPGGPGIYNNTARLYNPIINEPAKVNLSYNYRL